MRLRQLRIILWAAAGVALLAFAVLQSGLGRSTPEEAAFRPAFNLSDAQGRAVSTADFRGKYQMVFFGFTNCPDVCPTTLSELAEVMDGLGADAARVQPLFISIDPARDRALGLAEFTAAFHPAIIGLAGTDAATQAAADSFKVYFARTDDAASPGGYTMAHSPDLYLIGPEGDWLRLFTYGTPAADILADLQSRL